MLSPHPVQPAQYTCYRFAVGSCGMTQPDTELYCDDATGRTTLNEDRCAPETSALFTCLLDAAL